MPSSMRTPSRRMTLASVPSTNRRRSSIGSASSVSKGRRPPRGRQSMAPRVDGRENMIPPSPGGSSVTAPTASSRGKSIGGFDRRKSLIPPASASSTQNVRADPRPINDKVFQQQCIKQLLAFLIERGYECPISHKSLSRPSARDFMNICTFMLRLVDSNFQTGAMKFEDEVALNFKCIGYPYTISKTALVAAGSMHTWPALLAALSWLMDHLKSKQEQETLAVLESQEHKPFETFADLDRKSDRAFFDYLGKAYTAFMRNDAALTEQLESDLGDQFERDDNDLLREVERITDLNATIVERINALSQETQDLPTYSKKREDYATDLEQFHDLIRQMDDHKASLEQKVKERSSELTRTNAKLTKINACIEDLKKTIESQELSMDDIHSMESELKGLNEAMDRASALRDQRRKTLLASEKELLVACNSLESILSDYNSKMSELQLVPRLGADLANMKASLNKNSFLDGDTSKIVGIDVEAVVRPTISSFQIEFTREVEQTTVSYQDKLDQMESSNDNCKAANAKLKIVQDKTSKCEKTLDSEQETHNAKIAVRQREVEAMEHKVAARRDPVALEEQMAAYERQCAELEALRLEHQEENVARKKAVHEEIQQSYQLMVEHDKYFQHKLQELDEYWESKEGILQSIVVPPRLDLEGCCVDVLSSGKQMWA